MRPKGEKGRLLIIVGVLSVLVAGFMAYIAWAQERGGAPPQKQPIIIGWVDLDRLLKGMEEYKQQSQIYDRMVQLRLEAIRQLRQHFLFLSEEEWNEAVELLIKEKPTAKDKKRLEELRGLSRKREERFRELSGKGGLSPQERAELQRLGNYYTSNRQRIEQLDRKWGEELQRHEREVMSRLFGKIFDMVRKIAEERGFDVVMAYMRDQPPTVIYVRPELDLTDPLVEALNKAFRARSKKGK